MRVDISLNEEVLEFFKNRAEKNKRSRKSEIEIILTSFALNESLKEDKEEYFKPVVIKPIRVTLETLPKLSKAEQLRKLRGRQV